MSEMRVSIEGIEEIEALLETMSPKDSKKFQQKALAEAGKFLKPKVQAATPWEAYKRAVQSVTAKKNKPAQLVKYNAKKAPFRHIMIGGAKPHRIRFPDQVAANVPKTMGNIRHPGVKATPVIDRVADQYGDDALERAEKYLAHAFGLDE